MKTHLEKQTNRTALELVAPAQPAFIGEIRERVADVCRSAGLDEEKAGDISLAIIEAASNTIRHAGCENITVFITIGENEIIAKVTDQGCGFIFNEDKCKFPSTDSTCGRGLPIIFNLVDSLIVESKKGTGTVVTMIKNRVSHEF